MKNYKKNAIRIDVVKDFILGAMNKAMKNGCDKEQVMVKAWNFLGAKHGLPVTNEAIANKIIDFGYEPSEKEFDYYAEVKIEAAIFNAIA